MLPDASRLRDEIPELPQPVAVAVGRVVRSRTASEQLDAVLKAAEVLTRYTAVVALASYAAREDETDLAPLSLAGPLSFGHFLSVVQSIANRPVEHPVRAELVSAFRAGGTPADTALVALLTLRNREGHDLRHVDRSKAELIHRADRPLEHVVAAIDALRPLLRLPLVVVEEQRVERGEIIAECLFLAGEVPPFPEHRNVPAGVHFVGTPYLDTPHGLLCLSPGVIWDLVESQSAFGCYFVDRVSDKGVRYRSMVDGSLVTADDLALDVRAWVESATVSAENVHFAFDPRSTVSPSERNVLPGSDSPAAVSPGSEDWPETESADWGVIAEYLDDASQQQLLEHLIAAVRRQHPAVDGRLVGRFIEFTQNGRQVFVVVRRKGYLQVVLPLEPAQHLAEPGTRDLVGVRHWGEGDLEFRLARTDDVDRLVPLIELAVEPTLPVDGADGSAVVGDHLSPAALVDRIAGEDWTIDQIALDVGCSPQAVRAALSRHGLESLLWGTPRGTRASADQVHRYERGEPLGAIACDLQVRQVVALKCLLAAGALLRHDDSVRVGDRQPTIPRSVLESEFLEKKRTLDSIGEEYGISRQRVHQILENYGMPTRVDRYVDPAESLSEARLRYLYVVQGLSVSTIAEQVGLRPSEVSELAARWELARPRVHERYGLTKALLEETYVQERKSVDTIATELGVPRQAVSAALAHHGIALRTRAEAVGRGLPELLTAEYLQTRIDAGFTPAQIAREADTTAATVESYLVRTGVRPERDPDPKYDVVLSLESIQREYLDTNLTLAEFSAQTSAPQEEIRLRLKRAGLTVPSRQSSRIPDLPNHKSVEAAEQAGPPDQFPISSDELAVRYVERGESTKAIADSIGRSPDDVIRALCASGIDVRLGFEDPLSFPYLRHRYLDERATVLDLAREVGTSSPTVKKILIRYGIPVRGRGEARTKDRPELAALTEELLRVECVEKCRSATDLANELGCRPADVLTALRAFGFPTREATGGAAQRSYLRKVLTPAFLQERLVDQGQSPEALADEIRTTARTILRYAERAGIAIPPP